MTVVRRCARCQNIDMAHQWSSLDQAADEGIPTSDWACPRCAWPEAELIEMSAEEMSAEKVSSGRKSDGRYVDRTSDLDSRERLAKDEFALPDVASRAR